MIREIKEIKLKEAKTQNERTKIELAKTLKDLEMTFEEAIFFLQERGAPIILGEEDKVLSDSSNKEAPNYTSSEDFVFVHVTDFAPQNSTIYTPKDTEKKYTLATCIINGKDCTEEIKREEARDTVHLSVNHMVRQNDGGDWNHTRYAIFVPGNKMPKEKLIGGVPVDVFAEGSLNVKDAYMLCPRGERENIQKNNPDMTIIEYEGDKVVEYADSFVETLGYRLETGGRQNWTDETAAKQFRSIIEKEGLYYGLHSGSKDKQQEDRQNAINRRVALYKFIKDNNMILNRDDVINMEISSRETEFGLGELDTLEPVLKELGIEASEDTLKTIKEIASETYKDGNYFIPTNEQEAFIEEAYKKCGRDYRDKEKLLNYVIRRMILTGILKQQRGYEFDSGFVFDSEEIAKARAEALGKTTNKPAALSSVEALIEENVTAQEVATSSGILKEEPQSEQEQQNVIEENIKNGEEK